MHSERELIQMQEVKTKEAPLPCSGCGAVGLARVSFTSFVQAYL